MTRELSEDGECIRCGGIGMRPVYLGTMGGSVECDRCDGTGDDPIRGDQNSDQ